MLMPGAATLPPVSGVTTPTMHPAVTSVDAASLSQKDTTFTKIFVGGLPYHTTDKSLREHFEVYGEIEEAVVITDRQTGKSRGYGFVTMADRSGADRAIKDLNPVIDGRKANVNLAYIGAKPRVYQALTPTAAGGPIRIFPTQLTASSPYSYTSPQKFPWARFSDTLSPKTEASYALRSTRQAEHTEDVFYSQSPGIACMAAPTSYMYQMPYGTSAAHLPYLSTHPQLSASAAAAGYSPADFTTAAAYTASAFPGATTFDPYTMAFSAASLPHGYNYAALTHAAAAANAAGSFPISAAYPTAAAPQPALQEARMQ